MEITCMQDRHAYLLFYTAEEQLQAAFVQLFNKKKHPLQTASSFTYKLPINKRVFRTKLCTKGAIF